VENFELTPSTTQKDEIVVIEYKVPLIDKDNIPISENFNYETVELKNNWRLTDLLIVNSTVACIASRSGEIIGIKRDRKVGNVYYIDGVRVRFDITDPKNLKDDKVKDDKQERSLGFDKIDKATFQAHMDKIINLEEIKNKLIQANNNRIPEYFVSLGDNKFFSKYKTNVLISIIYLLSY